MVFDAIKRHEAHPGFESGALDLMLVDTWLALGEHGSPRTTIRVEHPTYKAPIPASATVCLIRTKGFKFWVAAPALS